MFDFVNKLHTSHMLQYNRINKALINNFFETTLQLLYWIFMQLPNY